RVRTPAEGPARRVSRRAECRLPGCVHRGWPDGRQDGSGDQSRSRRYRGVPRPRLCAQADGDVARARVPRRTGTAVRVVRSGTPGPSRPVRGHARRSRDRVTPGTRTGLAIATALGAGYLPKAPGTFGSAVGLLLWLALPHVLWVQLLAIVLVSVAGIWSG